MKNNQIREKILSIFIPFEFLFQRIVIILLCLVLVSQILLLNPITRQYTNKIDKLEGDSLKSIVAIPASQIKENQQWIELLLLEELPREEIIVYIDGIEFATFNELHMKIPILDEPTIQITVNGIPGIFSIQILDFSDNYTIEHVPGKVLEVSENTPLYIEF